MLLTTAARPARSLVSLFSTATPALRTAARTATKASVAVTAPHYATPRSQQPSRPFSFCRTQKYTARPGSTTDRYEDDDSVFQPEIPRQEKRPVLRSVLKKASPAEIIENVKRAVLEHVPSANAENWREASLADSSLKLKILLACDDNCNRRMPDNVISRIQTADDLATYLSKNPIDSVALKYFPHVREHMLKLQSAGTLPPNVLFIPANVMDAINHVKHPQDDVEAIYGYTDVEPQEDAELEFLDDQSWRVEPPIPEVEDPNAWRGDRKMKRDPIPRHWF